MNDVKKLREKLRDKEARYRAEMNQESDVLEDKMIGYAKNAGIIISVLAGGYFIAKSFQGKKPKTKSIMSMVETPEILKPKQKSSFRLPSELTQKLLVGIAQIGLAMMTMNVKNRMKSKSNGRNTESAND
jgi:hypothetical protein